MSEWLSIKNAPVLSISDSVLLLMPNRRIFEAMFRRPTADRDQGFREWVDPYRFEPLGEPTHWMPLPTSPTT